MNKKFYDFSSRFVSTTIQVSWIGLKPEKKVNELPNDIRLLMGDYENFSFPIVFKQEYGRKWQDILDTGYPSLFLISDNIKKAFQENNLTGWQTFDIKIFDKRGNEIEGYHGLSVTGRCGILYCRKSKIIEKSYLSDGPLHPFYKGYYFDQETWDGSDFFVPSNRNGTLITERVAKILKKNKFTNVFLENLTEIEIDMMIPNLVCRDE